METAHLGGKAPETLAETGFGLTDILEIVSDASGFWFPDTEWLMDKLISDQRDQI